MKLLRRVLFLSLLCLLMASPALAAEPLRIALLPVQDETGALDRDDIALLTGRLQQEIHIPLNGTLGIAVYQDPAAAQEALYKVLDAQPLPPGKKRRKPDHKAAVQELAKSIDADLVIYLRVCAYHQWLRHSIEEGIIIEAVVDMRLEAYDARQGRLVHDTATRYVHEPYSVNNSLQALSADALDELLERAKLRQAIYPQAH